MTVGYNEWINKILNINSVHYDPETIFKVKLKKKQVQKLKIALKNEYERFKKGDLIFVPNGYSPFKVPVLLFIEEYKDAYKQIENVVGINSSYIPYTDIRLTIKYQLNEKIETNDILPDIKICFTKWGKENIRDAEIKDFISELIKEWEEKLNGDVITKILEDVYAKIEKDQSLIEIYFHTNMMSPIKGFTGLDFSLPVVKFTQYIESNFNLKNVSRNFENKIRMKESIPKIGEGWIEETKLYNTIKQKFPDINVIHHARPAFLGSQHYDIYLPESRIAIEYQGIQHEQVIDFFGSKKGYNKRKKLDQRKKKLSLENNIKLIEVFPETDFEELVNIIKSYL